MAEEAFDLTQSLFPLNPEMCLSEDPMQALNEEEDDPVVTMNPQGSWLADEKKEEAMEPLEYASEPLQE
jgi:hypothetical protein